MFANSGFEAGLVVNCSCPTGYVCANDAGRVIDGFHPVFVVGNQGCIGTQNYALSLGAYAGTGYVYFYAGGDRVTTPSATFLAGDKVCICVRYAGPQGAGASGQNTANCYFRFWVDGIAVNATNFVPVNTGWTQYCYLATLTAGAHTFAIMSGGAAQYSIWFDEFTVNTCVALPIELISFEVRNNNGIVSLNWKTATETNNDYFTVEKSQNGSDFIALSTIKGAGDSQTLLNYRATDNNPYQGVSYYRLKQTDFNGNFTYSHLTYVNTESEINLFVYPNPNKGSFTLNIADEMEIGELILINALGQIVHKQNVMQGDTEINMQEPAVGIYNIIVLRDNQKVYNSKIIVE